MENEKVITINVEIDVEELQNIIKDAATLEDNALLFGKLAEIGKARKIIKDAVEAIDKIDAEAKGFINAKAKALYGNNWQTIVGPGYKIGRSFTGAKYEQIAPASEEFIVIKQSVDSKAVENYVKAHSELPEGIAVNQMRGEAIRITVKEDEHQDA